MYNHMHPFSFFFFPLLQACGTYTCRHRTHWWPMCIFYHIIDVSCYNAFVLSKAIDPSWQRGKSLRRRIFMEEQGKALVTPVMTTRGRLPRGPFATITMVQQGCVIGHEEQAMERGEEQARASKKWRSCGNVFFKFLSKHLNKLLPAFIWNRCLFVKMYCYTLRLLGIWEPGCNLVFYSRHGDIPLSEISVVFCWYPVTLLRLIKRVEPWIITVLL